MGSVRIKPQPWQITVCDRFGWRSCRDSVTDAYPPHGQQRDDAPR
jgi:hypothetical protein